jgi:hypothetical protein
MYMCVYFSRLIKKEEYNWTELNWLVMYLCFITCYDHLMEYIPFPENWRQSEARDRWFYLCSYFSNHGMNVAENFFFQNFHLKIKSTIKKFSGARRSIVGWGTMLQAGRSRVQVPMRSLDFSIDLFLPAAQWPWFWLSL